MFRKCPHCSGWKEASLPCRNRNCPSFCATTSSSTSTSSTSSTSNLVPSSVALRSKKFARRWQPRIDHVAALELLRADSPDNTAIHLHRTNVAAHLDEFFDALSTNTTIVCLSFSTGLADHLSRLFKVVNKHGSLQSLNLEENWLNAESKQAVFDFIRCNTTLRELFVNDSGLLNGDLPSLCDALKCKYDACLDARFFLVSLPRRSKCCLTNTQSNVDKHRYLETADLRAGREAARRFV